MAGLDDQQWEIVSKALDKISVLYEITIPKLDKKIDLVRSSIEGNGHKGIKERIRDLEKKPPAFSWKQVLAITLVVITFSSFITGFLTMRIDDQSKRYDAQSVIQSEQIAKLTDKLEKHILIPMTKP